MPENDNEHTENNEPSESQGAAPKAAPRRRRAASRPAGPPVAEAAETAVSTESAEAPAAAAEPAEAPEPRKRARRTRKKAEAEPVAETPTAEAPTPDTQAAEAPAAEPAVAGAAAAEPAEAPEPRKRARRTRKKAEAEPVAETPTAENPATEAPAAPQADDSLALLGELDQVEQQVESGAVTGVQLEALVADLVSRAGATLKVEAGSQLERRIAALQQRAAAQPAPAAAEQPAAAEEHAPRARRRAVRPATAIFQAPVFQQPEAAAPGEAAAAGGRRAGAPPAAFAAPDEEAPEAPARRTRRRAESPVAAPVADAASTAPAASAAESGPGAAAEGEETAAATGGRRRTRRPATAPAAPAAPTEQAVFEQVSTRAPLTLAEEDEEGAESVGRRRRRRRSTAPAYVVSEDTELGAEGEELAESDREAEDEESEDHEADSEQHGEEGRPSRRRRRGGRRRRRGDAEENEQAADEAEGEGQEDEEGEDEDDLGEALSSSSRRRRRRRRRSGDAGPEAESGEGDPERTVVKVREPRRRSAEAPFDPDEVQSIKGSTRLEAKKQRRREGREQGRRRVPIITEAEFLARREAVERVMVVRQSGERTQIGVLEDGVLVEHYVNKEQATSYVGNVYLGKVQNVLPSMEAAFVDIGKGRNAVLYAGEVNFSGLGLKNGPRRIESVLKSGQSVLVQVSKDPIGHKGARLTSQISLPGRYLVYVPEGSMTGISRKLPDTERARLKSILKKIVPDDAGVIVRTAAEGASEEELTRDVQRLQQQWEDIQKKATSGNAPALLYGEPDMTVRVVRDIFNEDFSKVIVQGENAWSTVHEYVSSVAPDLTPRLTKWTSEVDVFATYRIDEQLMKALDRKVWLPSGGSLVIDKTEAMVVVDVNTGKFTGQGGNLEETVTRNNIEAAEEIVRQLRLRDLGGIIVIDFIDMVLESNRDLVLRRLLECLGRDRTKHQVAEVTSLGLVQMTRKRVGQGLLESFSENCVHCNGRGVIVHMEQAVPAPKGFAGPKPGVGGGKSETAPAEEGGGSKRRRRGRGGDETPAETHEAHEHADHEHEEIELVSREPEVEAVVEVATEAAAPVAAEAAQVVDAAAQAEAEAMVEGMIEASAPRGRTRRRAVRKATSTVGAEPAVVVITGEPAAAPAPVAEPEQAAPTEPAEAEVEAEAAPPARKRAPRKTAAKKVAAKKTATKTTAKKTTAKRTSKKAAAGEPATEQAAE
ncbi:ribonuclease E/G [Streptacidiphilus sp. MAP5-3]|uniref:Rne/Rng family ribonuclease n=1 Tax=unclassified Streptacidiphilus TaxID=2643834 RepID=UPI003518E777